MTLVRLLALLPLLSGCATASEVVTPSEGVTAKTCTQPYIAQLRVKHPDYAFRRIFVLCQGEHAWVEDTRPLQYLQAEVVSPVDETVRPVYAELKLGIHASVYIEPDDRLNKAEVVYAVDLLLADAPVKAARVKDKPDTDAARIFSRVLLDHGQAHANHEIRLNRMAGDVRLDVFSLQECATAEEEGQRALLCQITEDYLASSGLAPGFMARRATP